MGWTNPGNPGFGPLYTPEQERREKAVFYNNKVIPEIISESTRYFQQQGILKNIQWRAGQYTAENNGKPPHELASLKHGMVNVSHQNIFKTQKI